jgi:hypothetical protein
MDRVRQLFKKSTTWPRLAGTLLLMLFFGIAVWLGPAYARSIAAARVYNRFATHVTNGDWTAADAMLAPGAELAIVNQRVMAFTYYDITDRISPTNPKWLAMIDYHRKARNEPTYIFEMGYAIVDVRHGQIRRIKLP